MLLALLACGTPKPLDTADSAPPATYHPIGWSDPSAHGIGAKYQQDGCVGCHGEDLAGGSAGVSCDGCHLAGWRTDCTFCHGGSEPSGAPPEDIDDQSTDLSFQAHTAHVVGTIHAPFDCTQCHVKPTDVLSPGHFLVEDTTPGVAEMDFSAGLSAAASWDGAGCGNAYCHGNAREPGSATDGTTVACGDCHAGPDDDASALSGRHADHLREQIVCADCHADTVDEAGAVTGLSTHVSGSVDLGLPTGIVPSGDTCTGSCHGEPHTARSWEE